MEFNVNDIKTLREKTGAGILDCKKALAESNGDIAKAEKLLKEWGLAGVEKRAGRATNEGRIFISGDSKKMALVEIDCETDFVARNADFIKQGQKIADTCFEKNWSEPNPEIENMVKDIASVIKENITLKAVKLVTADADEYLNSYSHNGTIGTVVKAKVSKAEISSNPEVTDLLHKLAIHVASFNPLFLSPAHADKNWIKEQEEIFHKQTENDEKMKSKPANVIEGIVKGKVNKLLSEICLLEQGYVYDEKQKVSAVLADFGKKHDCEIAITDFVYIKVGVSN